MALVMPGGAAGAAGWRWPLRGPVVGAFHVWPHAPFARGQRRGIDVSARPGAAVRAACPGRVTFGGPAAASRAGGQRPLRCAYRDPSGPGSARGARRIARRRGRAARQARREQPSAVGRAPCGRPPWIPRPAHAAARRSPGASAPRPCAAGSAPASAPSCAPGPVAGRRADAPGADSRHRAAPAPMARLPRARPHGRRATGREPRAPAAPARTARTAGRGGCRLPKPPRGADASSRAARSAGGWPGAL